METHVRRELNGQVALHLRVAHADVGHPREIREVLRERGLDRAVVDEVPNSRGVRRTLDHLEGGLLVLAALELVRVRNAKDEGGEPARARPDRGGHVVRSAHLRGDEPQTEHVRRDGAAPVRDRADIGSRDDDAGVVVGVEDAVAVVDERSGVRNGIVLLLRDEDVDHPTRESALLAVDEPVREDGVRRVGDRRVELGL
jgi:hypothetical protein